MRELTSATFNKRFLAEARRSQRIAAAIPDRGTEVKDLGYKKTFAPDDYVPLPRYLFGAFPAPFPINSLPPARQSAKNLTCCRRFKKSK
jgi:hypothetical protein